MENIRNWAFSLCCASIFGSILNMLLPDGNLQKTFKTVFCVFFLCILISPIADYNYKTDNLFELRLPETEYDFSENIFTDDSSKQIEDEIMNETKKALAENSLNFKEIFISTNISADGSINIIEFRIQPENYQDTDDIKKVVYETIGLMPEVTASGE